MNRRLQLFANARAPAKTDDASMTIVGDSFRRWSYTCSGAMYQYGQSYRFSSATSSSGGPQNCSRSLFKKREGGSTLTFNYSSESGSGPGQKLHSLAGLV